MRPIIFKCNRFIRKTAVSIATDIADVSRWQEFNGYGFLPGIEQARYERGMVIFIQ
ncbi:MAG: hypothetical protein GY943_34195 [Chloroflexi bacterium]|nr:hypothetical protein [Chloroflexota bacterium]